MSTTLIHNHMEYPALNNTLSLHVQCRYFLTEYIQSVPPSLIAVIHLIYPYPIVMQHTVTVTSLNSYLLDQLKVRRILCPPADLSKPASTPGQVLHHCLTKLAGAPWHCTLPFLSKICRCALTLHSHSSLLNLAGTCTLYKGFPLSPGSGGQ